MKHWVARCILALDRRMKFRALRCPFKLRPYYMYQVCSAARRSYKLIPFSGKIDLFRVELQPLSELYEEDPLLGWSGMAAGGIKVHQLPGDHTKYVEDPLIAEIVAAQLAACLEQASSKGR
jgi:thioesterase domain-containing protein